MQTHFIIHTKAFAKHDLKKKFRKLISLFTKNTVCRYKSMRSFQGGESFVCQDQLLCVRKCILRAKTLKEKVKIPREATAPLTFVVKTTKDTAVSELQISPQ